MWGLFGYFLRKKFGTVLARSVVDVAKRDAKVGMRITCEPIGFRCINHVFSRIPDRPGQYRNRPPWIRADLDGFGQPRF